MRADAVEACQLQGPHALQLLATCTADGPSMLRAWQAACTVADEDPAGALEAWLDFMHFYQCGQAQPQRFWPANLACAGHIRYAHSQLASCLCSAAGMALDNLAGILSHPLHNKAHQGLVLATCAFTSAWQAGDVSMRCWQVEAVRELGALSAHAVHRFLQQEAKVCAWLH